MRRKVYFFSLVELFIVVAVLVLIASLLQPSLGLMLANAEKIQCGRNIGLNIVMVSSYGSDFNEELPPYSKDFPYYSKPWKTYMAYDKSQPYNLGFLKAYGYMESGETLYCPSIESTSTTKSDGTKTGGHARGDNPDPWPTVPDGDWAVRTSYHFNPHTTKVKVSWQKRAAFGFAYPKIFDYPRDKTVLMDLLGYGYSGTEGSEGVAHQVHGEPGWWLGMIDGSTQYVSSDGVYISLLEEKGAYRSWWGSFGRIRDQLETLAQ